MHKSVYSHQSEDQKVDGIYYDGHRLDMIRYMKAHYKFRVYCVGLSFISFRPMRFSVVTNGGLSIWTLGGVRPKVMSPFFECNHGLSLVFNAYFLSSMHYMKATRTFRSPI